MSAGKVSRILRLEADVDPGSGSARSGRISSVLAFERNLQRDAALGQQPLVLHAVWWKLPPSGPTSIVARDGGRAPATHAAMRAMMTR
ncbi:MAG: hypothetical protein WDN25_05895 [Acetobacteraceae bacterium]